MGVRVRGGKGGDCYTCVFICKKKFSRKSTFCPLLTKNMTKTHMRTSTRRREREREREGADIQR